MMIISLICFNEFVLMIAYDVRIRSSLMITVQSLLALSAALILGFDERFEDTV